MLKRPYSIHTGRTTAQEHYILLALGEELIAPLGLMKPNSFSSYRQHQRSKLEIIGSELEVLHSKVNAYIHYLTLSFTAWQLHIQMKHKVLENKVENR